MRVLKVQFTHWHKVYYFTTDDETLNVGDYVIVETELGMELGKVDGFTTMERVKELLKEPSEEEKQAGSPEEIKPIVRRATSGDLDKARENESRHDEAMEVCRQLIKKHSLPMKLVDVHFSYDGGRITFAFIADGRIDFRNLVKDLTRRFQKSIRMHQIGVRDEAKISGDVGPCGRTLCCKKILRENYGGVNTEMAYEQQVAHRGLERLSGQCGRLKCCLRYELPIYEELKKKLPAIDSTVKTSKGKGKVIGHEILKQAVKVQLDEDTIITVPANEIKK
ncbi:MAG: regulatory iron-sulfur-containing complex subunit RicT [Patescibacteria group bacterium]|nr:regulatory iron-sulfur-containing complex subunit RicT [Patescibacteria group bacterium]MDD5490341.1 regulatory iron-sulfur-containing complex subunit RicT [Patescibacteria group bacterium]